MVWAVVGGFVTSYMSFYTLTGIVDETGVTADFWFMGIGMLYA